MLSHNVKQKVKRIIFNSLSTLPISTILNNWQGPCSILCFHRVLKDMEMKELFSPTKSLGVSETKFHELISFLNNHYTVISIDELYEHLKNKNKGHVVCLTFDDGYKDNLSNALPILENYGVPAAIYITTKGLEGNFNMWWFELWDFIANNSHINFQFNHTDFNLFFSTLEDKIKAYNVLNAFIITLALNEIFDFLTLLTKSNERKFYPELALNVDDLKVLDANPLITIGAHTDSHVTLSREDDFNSNLEILVSKEKLEKVLNHKIEHFAYPYGRFIDAGKREYDFVRDLGFKTGLSTNRYMASFDKIYCLPRYFVNEIDDSKSLTARMGGINNLLNISI